MNGFFLPLTPSVGPKGRSRGVGMSGSWGRSRGVARAALLAAAVLAAFPAEAAPTIPVRLRIIKGSRQGPPAVDPRLADLKPILSHVAYVRWDEVGEHVLDMAFGKKVELPLPDGSKLEVTLLESQKDTVTFEVRVPARKTQSRLRISKDKRILHAVTGERAGEAYFVTIRPWP